MELATFVQAFANGIAAADAQQPVALNKRSGAPYQAGMGPHTESETITLALAATPIGLPPIEREVPYPNALRSKCDLILAGADPLAIEVKMLRLMGDNGKPNDNMLMHILSPYPSHRSALTDGTKLLDAGFPHRSAIVIFGYDYEGLEMDPAIEAFERLAADTVALTRAEPVAFDGLVHPIHQRGRVFGWEIAPLP